ncbi:MAG: recombinase RecA [Clostridia bacterium]|nr:recombinase RecA [Clostridia bacterium]
MKSATKKSANTGAVSVLSDKEERAKAIKTAMAQIEREFGAGSIMKLGENANMEVQHISTGSLGLDLALGIGGVPRGRIVEIYGPESSGKTTVALHIVAEAQKMGGEAAFIDVEHALDPTYAKALGVDIDSLLVSQPDCGEDALEITEALCRTGAIDVVIVDSVAALTPRQEIEGDMGAATVGVQARLMSQAMRKLAAVVSKSHATVVFINQLREKVGVMYGNPETTPGGRALKFYASVRLDVRKLEQLKEGDTPYGNRVRAKVVKNKLAPPFRFAEFDLIFGRGISQESEVFDLAVRLELVQKSGSWFSYRGERLAQGRENCRKLLQSNPELMKDLKDQITALSQKTPTLMSCDEEGGAGEEDGDDEFAIDLLDGDGDLG